MEGFERQIIFLCEHKKMIPHKSPALWGRGLGWGAFKAFIVVTMPLFS